MGIPSRIAIAGLDLPWGAALARVLEGAAGVTRVWRLDGPDAGDTDVSRRLAVDPADPALAERLEAAGIDALVLGGISNARPTSEAAFQRDLAAAMHLASAAAAAGASRVVLRSSARVYGAWPDNPAWIEEHRPLRAGHRATQYNRGYVELERFADGFERDWPTVAVARLRFAPVLGPGTPLGRMLAGPAVATLAGFDPVIQALGPLDVARALARAATGEPPPRIVHVAPDHGLTLSQLIARAGRRAIPIPHPAAYAWAFVADGLAKPPPFPFELEWMRYACVLEVTHAHRMGYAPSTSTSGALEAYLEASATGSEAA